MQTDPNNQAIINDALKLQRDLLHAGVAVPARPDVVVQSMRESPHFPLYGAGEPDDIDDDDRDDDDRDFNETTSGGGGGSGELNGRAASSSTATTAAQRRAQRGRRRESRASILALLENVATSAAAFAKQIHDEAAQDAAKGEQS